MRQTPDDFMEPGSGIPCQTVSQEGRKKNTALARRDSVQGRDSTFDSACEKAGIPVPVSDYQPNPRMGRFRHCWPEFNLGVLVRSITCGRQSMNRAAMQGWSVILVTPEEIESGEMLQMVVAAMGEDGP